MRYEGPRAKNIALVDEIQRWLITVTAAYHVDLDLVSWQNHITLSGQYMPSYDTKFPVLKGWIAISTIKIIGLLPLSVARRLGGLLGWMCWLAKEKSSRTTIENLAICYPEMTPDERRELGRKSMVETGKLGVEICVIQRRSWRWLQRKIFNIHGEELLQTELAKGKGLIILAPHIGNWEVLALTLPTYGKLTALYQPPKQAYLESLVKKSREKTGATLVPTNRRGLAKLLVSLRSGGITAVLPDQNPGKGFGEFSPFFGTPAYTMTTVHGFVRRADCAVMMGIVKRVPKGFEIFFFKAPEEIYSADQSESLAALNKGVELCVSHCPEQYQWEYKRFKRKPEGVKKCDSALATPKYGGEKHQ